MHVDVRVCEAETQMRLTEGVSFSSDLSLSPCSKNSLVTSSATFTNTQIFEYADI